MKRRSFVKTSLLTGAASAVATGLTYAETSGLKTSRQIYELRIYTLSNAAQQTIVENFYAKTAIPAFNKLGVKPVGVFTELKPAGQTKVYVLIPYSSMAELDRVTEKLNEDTEYQTSGAAYLNAPATAPAYDRIESCLLKAFTNMPRLSVPQSKPRIFELRQYQSPSEAAGKKKIEMFNDAGEMAIFKRLGFNPVFWGETVIGAARPNLTYMLTFDDMPAHDRLWKAFGSDPDWKALSSKPEYANSLILSKINATFLMPASASQI